MLRDVRQVRRVLDDLPGAANAQVRRDLSKAFRRARHQEHLFLSARQNALGVLRYFRRRAKDYDLLHAVSRPSRGAKRKTTAPGP